MQPFHGSPNTSDFLPLDVLKCWRRGFTVPFCAALATTLPKVGLGLPAPEAMPRRAQSWEGEEGWAPGGLLGQHTCSGSPAFHHAAVPSPTSIILLGVVVVVIRLGSP